ncbi:hypothetical protein INR49_002698 [Caranx melampygus]|nr:hypothetical protein INR49_002698 [Caranx melampygus]
MEIHLRRTRTRNCKCNLDGGTGCKKEKEPIAVLCSAKTPRKEHISPAVRSPQDASNITEVGKKEGREKPEETHLFPPVQRRSPLKRTPPIFTGGDN